MPLKLSLKDRNQSKTGDIVETVEIVEKSQSKSQSKQSKQIINKDKSHQEQLSKPNDDVEKTSSSELLSEEMYDDICNI